ncbi:MAG: hypothetical protein CVT90_02320, partial [Candidatus Altiarchaeales archaeon HGW-Altiarchaeales-3]
NNNDWEGISLEYSSDNTIADNTVNSNHDDGIDLDSSSNNTIAHNTIKHNIDNGIYIKYDSDLNNIYNNDISNNDKGLYLSTNSETYAGGIKVDNGTYKLIYFSFGFEAINNQNDRDAVMSRIINYLGGGNVLVVDDDQEIDENDGTCDNDSEDNIENYYIAALNNNGISYDYLDICVNGSPTYDNLSSYSVVIWFTGEEYPDTAEQGALEQYLNNGGNLFITGQDIGDYLIDDGEDDGVFYSSYLHANNDTYSVHSLSLSGVDADIGNNLNITIQGGDGANNQEWLNGILPINGAVAVFNYTIVHPDNNNISNNKIIDNNKGIYIKYGNNNILNENYVCENIMDIKVSYGSGNSGDDNTCNNYEGWNDEGTTGCTYRGKFSRYVYKFGPHTAFNGSVINYTISIGANYKGNVPFVNVTIIDILPEDVSYIGNTLSEPKINGSSLEWNVSLDCYHDPNTNYSFCIKSFILSGYISSSVKENTVLRNFVEVEDGNNDTWDTIVKSKFVDVGVWKSGSGARPGFYKTYSLYYYNQGTVTAENVIIIDKLPSQVSYVSSTGTYDSSTHTVTWNINKLNPSYQENVLKLKVYIPPTVLLGTLLINEVNISANDDENNENNYFVEKEEVVGSLDPNDKLVDKNIALKGDTLHYIIRFENKGNADAINIRIEDVLDEMLNESTLIISNITNAVYDPSTRKITWIFPNINLPPNETGQVVFEVKINNDVLYGDIIRNNAIIYFDFNSGIVTPTVNVTIGCSSNNECSANQFCNSTYSCQDLNCPDGYYLFDHQC